MFSDMHRPYTPEPTGVMSPGDISVSNMQGNQPLETSGISEVAKANSQTGQPDADDDDDDSSSSEEDEAVIVGGGNKTKKPKSAKGKKGKGAKGAKKSGKKGGKKDGDGKKAKNSDKKSKDKKSASSKKGKGKKNKNNNNNRNCDVTGDFVCDFYSSDIGSVVSEMNEATKGAHEPSKLDLQMPSKTAISHLLKESGLSDRSDVDSVNSAVFAMSNDVDPMQFSRRSNNSDWPRNVNRPTSRCNQRAVVDSVTIPMPVNRKGRKHVSFNKAQIAQEMQDFSDC